MAWADIKSKIVFWDATHTWTLDPDSKVGPVPTGDPDTLTDLLKLLYDKSTTAQLLIEALADKTIRIGQSDFSRAGFAAGIGTSIPYIGLNLSAIKLLYYFNKNGTLVNVRPELVIIHEISHIVDELEDPDYNETKMNGPDFDFSGDVVARQNAVAYEMEYFDQLRASYFSGMSSTDARFSYFKVGESYSRGGAVDIVRLGDHAASGIADTIDQSKRTDDSRDLLFGLGGNDIIKGGGGVDFAYGGDGNDTLSGGNHDDVLVGEADDDKFYGEQGNDELWGGALDQAATAADGKDEARYDKVGAADGPAINIVFSGTAGSELLVYDGNGGTDTLHSIERITGSKQKDVLTIGAVLPALIEAMDSIDLGANPSGIENGDLVDLSAMTVGAKVDLAAQRFELVANPSFGFNALVANPSPGFKLLNAENVYGGEGDDQITGDNFANDLRGGGGADKISGGGGDDRLDGGDDNAGDELCGGPGADDIYAGSGDHVFAPDQGDRIFLDGIKLTGGEYEHLGNPCDGIDLFDPNDNVIISGTYAGSDGTLYSFSANPFRADVLDLVIYRLDGSWITIEGFTNGEAGIALRNGPLPLEGAECNRDPLILDLNGDRSVVAELYDVQVYFDMDGNGVKERVAWALPEDGLLAMDRDGDGFITSGLELFGTGTTRQSGNLTLAMGSPGFDELAAFDANKDLLIDASDAAFGALRVWQDSNLNGISEAGELKTLAELGLVSIDLRTRDSDSLDCGCDGTVIPYMSSVTRADGSKLSIYDAFLSVYYYDSLHPDRIEIPPEVAGLPFLIGSGAVRDLHSAMALDPVLRQMVEALTHLSAADAGSFTHRVEAMLLRWAGADRAVADGRGPYINGQALAAIEAFYGTGFKNLTAAYGLATNPQHDAAAVLVEAWRDFVDLTAAQLLGQIPLGGTLLPGLTFELGAFFSASDGVTVDGLLRSLAANAPTGAAAAMEYWHLGLAALAAAASEFGLSVAQVDALAQPYLDAADIDVASRALRKAFFGGASWLLSGTMREMHKQDLGDDLLIAGDSTRMIKGGTGDDTYVLRLGQKVTLAEISGVDEIWLPDLSRSDVQVGFALVDGRYNLLVRSLDLSLGAFSTGVLPNGSFTTGIEWIRFADGSRIRIQDLVSAQSLGTPVTDLLVADATAGTVLDGGAGNDLLVGYDGDDTLYGGTGVDRLGGDDGADRLDGGAGPDVIDGGGGADTASYAGSAAVTVNLASNLNSGGEAAGDVLHNVENLEGTSLADRLSGDFADNVIDGGPGDDVLHGGGGGGDSLRGNEGNDSLTGGDGSDRLEGGAGADIMDGGNGIDAVSYGASGSAVTVNLATGVNSGGDAQGDTISQVEWIYGSSHHDSLTGNGGDNVFHGNDGDDSIDGGGGADLLYGDAGDDSLTGGAGDDWLDGGAGGDRFIFGAGGGNDVIDGFDGEGGDGGDVIRLVGLSGFRDFAAVQAATRYDFAAQQAFIDLGAGNVITVNGISQPFASSDFIFV